MYCVCVQDVLLALSEEVYRTDAEDRGATIDLPKSYHAEVSDRIRTETDIDTESTPNQLRNRTESS